MTIASTLNYSGRQIDLELLQSLDRPVQIERVSLSLVNSTPKIVAGIQKLAQRYAVLLLSPSGETHFDSENGTSLVYNLASGNVQDLGRLQQEFSLASLDAVTRLRSEEESSDIYGDLPDDEKIDNALLLDHSIDYTTSTVYLSVQLTTIAGSTLKFVIPTTVPRY